MNAAIRNSGASAVAGVRRDDLGPGPTVWRSFLATRNL